MAKNRFRRLTELFVVGAPVPLDDGTYLWVQALNSYQRDECISDAQVARSRMVMALRTHGDERTKIEARFYELGREQSIEELAQLRMQSTVSQIIETLRDDPEWKERLAILLRSDTGDTAEAMSLEELALLKQINEDVMAEMGRREEDEKDYQKSTLNGLTDEEIIEEWLGEWLETRGNSIASGEYKLTELWYATRFCNATLDEDGVFDHSGCEGHSEQVFETRQDVRGAPEPLINLITSVLVDLNLVGRDPKDLARPTSSSGSSPTPSAAEESTPSTSTETPPTAPGTSPSPSPTPSPSSAGSN
jgi:cell division septation protein DedD